MDRKSDIHIGYRLHRETYIKWAAMKNRCRNKSHPYYEKYKDVHLHPAWIARGGFWTFLKDMGECPEGMTLDRIKNERGYEPGNCKWSTRKEQATNRKSTVWLEWEGQTYSMRDLAEKYGMGEGTLRWRLKRGWPLRRALLSDTRTYHTK